MASRANSGVVCQFLVPTEFLTRVGLRPRNSSSLRWRIQRMDHPNNTITLRFDFTKQPVKPSFAFFYCDVFRSHLTEDTITQSIRAIPIEKTNKPQHTIFEKPLFFPIARYVVREMRIVLKDEYGKDADAVAGSVFGTIGIRPVSI